MSLIPQFKIGDCSRCDNRSVACKKRAKVLLCLRCCNVDDNKKQVAKAKLRDNAIRAKISPSKTSRQSSSTNSIEGQEGAEELQEMALAQSQWDWFLERRKEMTGKCSCGCKKNSSKYDEGYFHFSVAHLFPKKSFKSIAKHPLNWVERSFWNGCHSQMDDGGLDKWVNFADWEDIKVKFKQLEPLLTEKEKGLKFYNHLKSIVYDNSLQVEGLK